MLEFFSNLIVGVVLLGAFVEVTKAFFFKKD